MSLLISSCSRETGRLWGRCFVNPQVSVGIEQFRSQRVSVTGEVRMPGMIPPTGGMTLVDALSRGRRLTMHAGGISDE